VPGEITVVSGDIIFVPGEIVVVVVEIIFVLSILLQRLADHCRWRPSYLQVNLSNLTVSICSVCSGSLYFCAID